MNIDEQFSGVENGPKPTITQLESIKTMRAEFLRLARIIDATDLHPRYKATALTNLETAMMYAIKGAVFNG